MKIRKTSIPENSLIAAYSSADYSDAFECTFAREKKITADEFMIAFWTHSPQWINRLFALRDWLVKFIGLESGSNRSKEKLTEAIHNNGSYGFMKVEAKSINETFISANDKHLKMYFSVKIEEQGNKQLLTVSTVVQFHNCLGRVYFYAIYPFHQFIVPGMIKFTLKGLTNLYL